MEKLNSTQKGDLLEKKTYDHIKELLKNEEFFLSGKNSEIFPKKAYYSEKRKGNIIFDIAIETYLPNSKTFSILTLIECKNLNRTVSVDDIEEFSHKISQIGVHNTKGVLITTSNFQERAFNLGKSEGIALARMSDTDKLDWINYRKEKLYGQEESESSKSKFITDKAQEKFIGSIGRKFVDNLPNLLIECGAIDSFEIKESFIKVPYVTEDWIKYIVQRLSDRNVYSNEFLDTEKLIELMSSSYNVVFEFNETLPNNLLGKIEFDPLKIYISSNLIENENRWRFTLAHEIGHLILHFKLFRGLIDEKSDTERNCSVLKPENKRVELQANIFASHLLLPNKTLLFFVNQYFVEIRNRKGKLYLDNKPYNREIVYTLLSRVSLACKVSVDVVRIRLIQLDLLTDATNTSLKSVFKQIRI